MKFDDVYAVDADISPTEFMRSTYINLARNSYTPKVLEGAFSAVETSIMQVVGCRAYVETAYTFDRIIYVNGTIMDTVRERRGRSWVDKQVPKQVQLPQHIPEKGETSREAEGCVLNLKDFTEADNPASYLYYMNYNIPDMAKVSKHHPDKEYPRLELTDEAYIRSTKAVCDTVNSMATLPDEYDNITFDPTYYVKQVNCYMVPFYSATYTLGTDTYSAKGFACGSVPKVWNTCPAGINNTTIDQWAEKKTGVKVVKYLFPVLTWVMYAIAIVLSLAVGVSCFWTFVLSFFIYLIGIIAYVAAANRFNKYAANMQPRWANDMINTLNSLFTQANMRSLTVDEVNEFKSMDFVPMRAAKNLSVHNISSYCVVTLVIQVISLLMVLFIGITL